MSTEVIVILIVVLITDALFLFVFLKARKRKREANLQVHRLAEEEGWKVLPLTQKSEVYRISGALSTGITWEMAAKDGKSSKSSRGQYLQWNTKDVQLQEEIIALGPGTGMSGQGVDLNNRLIQLALRKIFGQEMARELADAKMVDSGNEDFSRHYTLLTDDEELARRFLGDPLARILIDWHSEDLPMPGIILWKGGLQVRFENVVNNLEGIRKIVALCGVLALRGREIAASQSLLS